MPALKKRAKWIGHYKFKMPIEYECSRCSSMFYEMYSECPSCGAVMQKKKDSSDYYEQMEMLEWLGDY